MRFFFCFLMLIVLSFSFPKVGHAELAVSGHNALLMEQSTGRVLYEKNGYEEESIASITKVMTAIIAIESGKLQEKAKASRNAIYTEGSSIYLEQGEEMTIEDLLYGLMLRSGNDAAVAIAEHIGESEEGFVYLMNEKAKWLGMDHTHFDNPHGLDSDSHYSSAYDIALLTRYAMSNETFVEIFGTKAYKSENRTYSWHNKNKLLTQYYDHTTGGKTGYTKKTGRTLVTTASKNGLDLIAVTLNAPDDWRDHMRMYDWAFEKYEMEKIASKGEVSYRVNTSDNERTGIVLEDIFYPLAKEERDHVEQKNYLLPESEESSVIGKSFLYLNGEKIEEILIYDEQYKGNFFDRILLTFKKVAGM